MVGKTYQTEGTAEQRQRCNWQIQVGDRMGTKAGKMGRSLILSLICPTSLDFTLRVKVFKSMIVFFIPWCWCGGWTIRVVETRGEEACSFQCEK